MSGGLVNNITVNWLLSPLYFGVVYFILKYQYPNVPNFSPSNSFFGLIPLCLLSTWFYCYSSTFFQPDLDGDWRPGQKGFPLGKWVFKYPWGNTAMFILKPVNRSWFYMWHLYSRLITHRGMSHWPVIGAWTRAAYVYIHIIFINYLLIKFSLMNYESMWILYWLEKWTLSFFPWNDEFGTAGFYLFTFPVFLADIMHSLVDYLEARAKGNPFVPSLARKGWIYKLTADRKNTFKGIYRYLSKF